jgi:hypothetical protein
MDVHGADILAKLAAGEIASAKMVFNRKGAAVFPVSKQHRDVKGEGLSYEDNYKGNALAAMLTRTTVEVRFHQAFTDAEVATILRELATVPGMEPLPKMGATYQGRVLKV